MHRAFIWVRSEVVGNRVVHLLIVQTLHTCPSSYLLLFFSSFLKKIEKIAQMGFH